MLENDNLGSRAAKILVPICVAPFLVCIIAAILLLLAGS